MKQLANYHTHTLWCRHATGDIEDYIEMAIRHGFRELAITEHVPHIDNLDGRRMLWEEFPAFDRALDAAIENYKEQIHIIKGFECEYFKEALKAYESFRRDYNYELFILGQHNSGKHREIDHFMPKDEKALYIYADEVCEALDTGIFDFLAHPDLVLVGYKSFDKHCESIFRQIFKKCEALDIPIEINANGLRSARAYPDKRAFELSKEYKLRYLLNSDAHAPEHMVGEHIAAGYAFAEELGIEIMPFLDLK